jgi:hypothetical protein
MANRYWIGGSGSWVSTTKWSATSGGSGGASIPTSADDVFFDQNSDAGLGTITVTFASGINMLQLNCSALDVNLVFNGSSAINVYGNLTLPTDTTKTVDVSLGSAAAGVNMLPASQRSIRSYGGTLIGGMTMNGAAGITLVDDFAMTGTFLHTAGQLNLSGLNFTMAAYNSTTTSGVRSISWASTGSKITVNGTGTAPWNLVSGTNLTITGQNASIVDFTNSSSTTRVIRHTVGSTAAAVNFNIKAGTDTVQFTAASYMRDVNFTGFSGTWDGSTAFTLSGDLTLSTGMTCAAGAGIMTITNIQANQAITLYTNGKALNRPITYTALGTTSSLNLVEDLICDAAFIFNLGTLNLNDYKIRCTTWASSSGSNRVLNFSTSLGADTGSIECTGASFTMTNGTGFSYNYTSRIIMSQATASGGTKTINCTGITTFAQSMDFYISNDASGSSLSITAASILRTLDLSYGSGSSASIAINAFTLYGDCILGGSSTFTATTTAVLTFAASSTQGSRGDGVQKIFLNATGNFNRPITKSGSGTLELNSDIRMGTTSSITLTHSAGTINLGGYSLTIFGTYSSSGSTARSLYHGGYGDIGYIGKIYLNAGSAVTVWDTSTATNWTSSSDYGYERVQVYVTGAVTKTLNFGSIVEGSTVDVNFDTTASTVTVSGAVNNVKINNGGAYTVAIASAGTWTIYGDFTVVGNSPVLSFSAGTISFAKTSGSQVLTSLGEVFNGPVTKSGAGTLYLNGALQIGTSGATTTYTQTAGTLDISYAFTPYTMTVYGTFTITGSTTRSLKNTYGDNSGSNGKIIIFNSTATTIYTAATSTGFTTDGNVVIDVQGATNGVTVIPGSISEADKPPSWINSRTSGTLTMNAGNIQNIYAATITAFATTMNIFGDVTISSGAGTLSAVTSMTFAKTSGTQTLTTNGKTITSPSVIKDGAGTLQLQDALTISAGFTHTAGTFDVQGFTFTCPSTYSSLNTNTRVLKFSSGGKITLSGSSTVWDTTATNYSVNGLSNGTISCTSASAKTFNGGGGSYPLLEHAGTINGSGTLTISGNNTFYNLTNTNRPTTIQITGGSNQTFTNDFDINGAFDQSVSTYSVTLDTTPKYVDYIGYTLDSNIGQPGYTVEFFIKFNTLSTTATMTGFTYSPASSPSFAANTTAWNVSNAGYSTRGTATGLTLTTGVWYHFAYIGIANNTYMAVNGVVKNLNNVGGANAYTPNGIWVNTFKLGNGPVTISNYRITANGSIYSLSGFTPIPAKPYLLDNSTNPILLTLNSSTFVDQSPRAATITVYGSPSLAADTISSADALTPTFNRVTLTSTNTTPFTLTKTSGTDPNVNCCSISYSNAVGTNGVYWRSYNTLGNLDQGNNQDWVFGNKFINYMMV